MFHALEEKQKNKRLFKFWLILMFMKFIFLKAEIAGKINEKKNLAETLKKKNIGEISDFSDFLSVLNIQ